MRKARGDGQNRSDQPDDRENIEDRLPAGGASRNLELQIRNFVPNIGKSGCHLSPQASQVCLRLGPQASQVCLRLGPQAG
jgi:hypothetical protein